jgi:alpha,alpha-trehalase
MLFYLFSAEEIEEIFEQLGYEFEYETIPENSHYYLERSSHGSTLSWVVHSWVLSRSHREQSWEMFREALRSDVADIQGGTTPEGIHLGAMAGTIDLLQRGYTGIVTRHGVLWFNPCLPEGVKRLRMHIRYRGHPLDVELTPEKLRITSRPSSQRPIRIGFDHEVHELEEDSFKEFALE